MRSPFLKTISLATLATLLAGCVMEPYPPAPPGAVVGAPPVAYDCCYSYYDYPPYYYGPAVGVGVGYYGGGGWGGGWGHGGGWRGR